MRAQNADAGRCFGRQTAWTIVYIFVAWFASRGLTPEEGHLIRQRRTRDVKLGTVPVGGWKRSRRRNLQLKRELRADGGVPELWQYQSRLPCR